ncbi:MAG: hypothetical protein NVS4B8_23310 [Herpetosiphon sp.]
MSSAEELRSLVAAFCVRPAVRHELGVAAGTPLVASVIVADTMKYLYRVTAPDGRTWLLLFAIGSRFGLSSAKQIAYQAWAMRLVEPASLSPQICYVDATLYHLPFGALVMEELAGTRLDRQPQDDMLALARALARLHRIKVPPGAPLFPNQQPLQGLLDGAEYWLRIYAASHRAVPVIVELLGRSIVAGRRFSGQQLRFEHGTLVHGNPVLANWIAGPPVRRSLPGGILAIGANSPALRLVGWYAPRLDDPSADLCAVLASWALKRRGDGGPTESEQNALLMAYLTARPELVPAALQERVALRLRFAYLYALCREVATQDEHLTPPVEAMHRLLGPWLSG